MSNKIKNISSLKEAILSTNIQQFELLVDNVVKLIDDESEGIGDLTVLGKLVKIPPRHEAIIIGDIHGDMESLIRIFEDSFTIEKLNKDEKPLVIFLGDYGDRGPYSPEVYYIVLKLKETYPENVVLLRGNHEGPNDLIPHPHDLPNDLRSRFGTNWPKLYVKLTSLFTSLYTAVLVEKKCIMLHGGVPSQAVSLENIAFAHIKHPFESHLEEILWNDPEEGLTGTRPSPRGAGKLFGENVTESFLKMLGVKVLVRGHEPSNAGFKINHLGKIVTLFSRKGEPYYNRQGAYLQLDLGGKFENAYKLRTKIRVF